jgi:BolA protein
MNMQATIEQKLAAGLDLQHLDVVNESGNHNVPPGSESHFKVVLVSEDFQDLRLIQRHRQVNKILKLELSDFIHALAIHTFTASEWQQKHHDVPLSPPCLGG